MGSQIDLLYLDLESPVYGIKFAVTKDISKESFLLFVHETWKILVFVKKVAESVNGAKDTLLVDICKFHGCKVPSRLKDIFFYGVDIDVKSAEGKVFRIPFLQVGQGFLLAEEISNKEEKQTGTYYEINSMSKIERGLFC